MDRVSLEIHMCQRDAAEKVLIPVYFQGLGQPQTEWDVLLSPKHWLLLSLKITELSSC